MTGRHLQVVGETDQTPKAKHDAEFAVMIERAALTIRYRASQAMPGPWQAWPASGQNAEIVTAATTGLTVGIAPPPIEDVGWSVAPGTAHHIANWPPEVAVLVADWMDDLLKRMRVDGYGFSPAEESHAYLIAKGVLGVAG